MDDNGWDARLYGFKESKYEELLQEVYKLYPHGAEGPTDDVRAVWAPLRLVVDDSDNRLLLNPRAKFEVPVYKEYINEPEPKVGLVYILQRHKPEGRVFSNWKNCGSKKVNSTIPSTLKVRYFQHKAPDLSDVRKRVITLNSDNEEMWKLVHVIHKPPRDGIPKRRKLSDSEQAPSPASAPATQHHLVQLASALHQQAMAQPEKEVCLTSLVPNHGPADHRIVVKVQGDEFTRRVQVVWGGVALPEGVIYRNGHELWLETPHGRAGLSIEVHVQEVVGETVVRSNSLLYTYDHLPEDEPLLKRMKAVEDKITQFEYAMSRFGPNAAHADGTSTNNNNNNSEEVEKFLTQLGNLDKVLEEARQLFRDINAHFNARHPASAAVAKRINQLRATVEGLPRASKRQRTTEDEHHALMALAGLADPTASPTQQGDSSASDSPTHSGGETVYYCSTCDIHCNSQVLWNDHLTSGRHLSATVKKLGPNEYHCDSCNFTSHSQQSIDMHTASPDHRAISGATAVHINA